MNNDNNLEKSFKSVFDFDEIEQSDWNIPSEQVWVNIEGDLKRKNRRILMYSWLSTLGVFLFCAAIYLFGYKKPENLLSQLTKSTTEIQAKTYSNFSTINAQQIQAVTQNASPVKKVQAVESIFENKVEKIDNLKENKFNQSLLDNKFENKNASISKQTVVVNSIVTENQIPNTNLVVNDVLVPTTESIDNKEQAVAYNNKANNVSEPRSSSSLLEALPVWTFSMLNVNKTNLLNISNLPSITPIKISKPSSIVVSVIANSFKLENRIKGNISKFDGEKLKNAFSVGINVSKPLRNSFVEIGAAYAELNYVLNYNIALLFNGNGETQNKRGNFDNIYNGSVPTSFGNLNMQMVLARQQGHSVTQGEAIPLTAKGTERLSFINIPISWGKNIRLAPKFYATGKMTFSNNFLLTSSTQFEEVVSHHDAVLETLTVVKSSPKPTIWTPFMGASVGINYRLSSKLGIGASTFLQQSLKPMFKSEQYSNTPAIFGGGINVEYRF